MGFFFPPSSLPQLGVGCLALGSYGGRHFPRTGVWDRGPSLLLGSELNSVLSQAGDDRRRQASEGERMERSHLGGSQEHPG